MQHGQKRKRNNILLRPANNRSDSERKVEKRNIVRGHSIHLFIFRLASFDCDKLLCVTHTHTHTQVLDERQQFTFADIVRIETNEIVEGLESVKVLFESCARDSKRRVDGADLARICKPEIASRMHHIISKRYESSRSVSVSLYIFLFEKVDTISVFSNQKDALHCEKYLFVRSLVCLCVCVCVFGSGRMVSSHLVMPSLRLVVDQAPHLNHNQIARWLLNLNFSLKNSQRAAFIISVNI